MSGRPFLPPRVAALFLAELQSAKDGCVPSGGMSHKLLKRATEPHIRELVNALAAGQVRPDNWIEISIVPSPDFKAHHHTPGTPVDIAFSLKSGRFVSSAAPSARIGFVDLAAHIWNLRAPAARGTAEQRLLALLGLVYLKSLADPGCAHEEAA
jgi:hypothetical protein